jgi:hypothetical protein
MNEAVCTAQDAETSGGGVVLADRSLPKPDADAVYEESAHGA